MMNLAKLKMSVAAALVLAAGLAGVGVSVAQSMAAGPTVDETSVVVGSSGAIPLEVDPAVEAEVAKASPVVVSTSPRAGSANVDPSLTEIRVTYSKPMTDHSWSWCQNGSGDSFPQSAGTIHYEKDHCTCVMPVKLAPGKVYKLYLNRGQFRSFMDEDGNTAVPYELVFGTTK